MATFRFSRDAPGTSRAPGKRRICGSLQCPDVPTPRSHPRQRHRRPCARPGLGAPGPWPWRSTPGPRSAADAAGAGARTIRAYALNAASVAAAARAQGLGDALGADARTAVYDMRIAGDAAGELGFSAWQQAVPALAWIVDVPELEQVLETALRFAPAVHAVRAGEPATAARRLRAHRHRRGQGGRGPRAPGRGLRAPLHYGHSALTRRRVVSDRPHAGIARQWFRAPDVLALLSFDRPAPGHSYGIVWSLPASEAERLRAAGDAEFEAVLNEVTGGEAGRLALGSARATWPLMQATAAAVCGPGWALVGDAAHVIHTPRRPGPQTLAWPTPPSSPAPSPRREAVARARRRDLAAPLCAEAAAWWPTRRMAGAVDGLWQLFSTQAPGARELRNRGLDLVNHLGPLQALARLARPRRLNIQPRRRTRQ